MRLLCSLFVATLLGGCAEDDFEQRSDLARYRILAIGADQPEPSPEATVILTAHEYIPVATPPIARRWSVCLLSAGAIAQYACADPQLEFEFETRGPTLVLDLGPGGFLGPAGFRGVYAIATAELERLRAADPDTPLPTLPALSEGVPVYIKTSFAPTGAERPEDAVKTLVVREGGTPNQNPTVASVNAPRQMFAGQTVTVRVVIGERSVETFASDIDLGGDRCTPSGDAYSCREELTYSWYADAPAVSEPVGYGELRDTQVTLPDAPGTVQIVVAVRDGRGGLAVARRTLSVLPR